MSKTSSLSNFALHYCSDRAQYFGLEFSFYPLHEVTSPLEALLLGRDEKGCKLDVDRRRQVSTVDGLEKCSLVDVDQ